MQKLDNKHRKHFYVALYERVSKDDKDGKKESESITNQDKILKQYISDLELREPGHTFEIVDEYVDDGCTGTNFDRPDFIRMIKDIENGM